MSLVTEELADHRQALTQGESPGRVGVPEVVNSYVLKPGFLANAPPRCVQVAQAGAGRRALISPRGYPARRQWSQ